MINPNDERFFVFAGETVNNKLFAEKDRIVPRSTVHSDCYASEALCRWQGVIHQQGYKSVELVKSLYGWSVRADCGLDMFELLASSRLKQVDGSLNDATMYAIKWVNEDPEYRYAWVRKSNLREE